MSTTDATAAIDAASAAISAAAAVIRNADAIIVTTGAGMGVDSGLGTFRGRNAGAWLDSGCSGVTATAAATARGRQRQRCRRCRMPLGQL